MHLLELVHNHSALQQASQALQRAKSVALTSTPSAAWGVVAATLQSAGVTGIDAPGSGRSVLLVTPDGETAERLANDLSALFNEDEEAHPRVLVYPIPERAGSENVEGDRSATQERLAAPI